MGTNPEDSRQPRNPPQDGGEAEAKLLDAVQELGLESIPESKLSNVDVLMGLEESCPGFIGLVLVRIPEGKPETLSLRLLDAMKDVITEQGEEKLAGIVAAKAASESGLADVKSLMKFEEFYPGFINIVFDRMREIEQQTKHSEAETMPGRRPRKFGESVIGIFKKRP